MVPNIWNNSCHFHDHLSFNYQICLANAYYNLINPSAWSDGHRPHTVNITFRGVTGTARMLHALTHSSISRQVREQM